MIVFKEILPNPSGSDINGEWIKIINIGGSATSLSGWSLKDESGKSFYFSNLKKENQTILPSEEITLPYSVTKITLNNSRDKLLLINNSGKIESQLTYQCPINNDEIVFGEGFTPKTNSTQASIGDIKEYAIEDAYFFNRNINLSPVLVGFLLATTFSFGIGFLIKKITEEK